MQTNIALEIVGFLDLCTLSICLPFAINLTDCKRTAVFPANIPQTAETENSHGMQAYHPEKKDSLCNSMAVHTLHHLLTNKQQAQSNRDSTQYHL